MGGEEPLLIMGYSPATSCAGGYKTSGIGRDKGMYALEHYTQARVWGLLGACRAMQGRCGSRLLKLLLSSMAAAAGPLPWPSKLTPCCCPRPPALSGQGRLPEPGAQPALDLMSWRRHLTPEALG